jgi:rhamnosyltransferase
MIILLSTYNGSLYLSQFLDSLVLQTDKEFKLIIRDDGSNDNTMDIIRNYCKVLDIKLYKGNNIGPFNSFTFLVDKFVQSDAEFALFADQDDVWSENKIQEFRKAFVNSSIVTHDYNCLHEENDCISEHILLPTKLTKEVLLAWNPFLGCCMGFDKSMASLYMSVSNTFFSMHDRKMVLLACFNNIGHTHINIPLINYRIHSNNTIGHDVGLFGLIKKIKKYYTGHLNKQLKQLDYFNCNDFSNVKNLKFRKIYFKYIFIILWIFNA